jgi:hypothetical protein
MISILFKNRAEPEILTKMTVCAYEAHVTTGRRSRSGAELAAIGIASALVGYAVGALLEVRP